MTTPLSNNRSAQRCHVTRAQLAAFANFHVERGAPAIADTVRAIAAVLPSDGQPYNVSAEWLAHALETLSVESARLARELREHGLPCGEPHPTDRRVFCAESHEGGSATHGAFDRRGEPITWSGGASRPTPP